MPDLRELGSITRFCKIEPEAKLDVVLGHMVAVDRHLSDLVAGIAAGTTSTTPCPLLKTSNIECWKKF